MSHAYFRGTIVPRKDSEQSIPSNTNLTTMASSAPNSGVHERWINIAPADGAKRTAPGGQLAPRIADNIIACAPWKPTLLSPTMTPWCAYRRAFVIEKSQEALITDYFFKKGRDLAVLIIMFVLLAIGMSKIVISGFEDFEQYATNWSWTCYSLFFLLIILGTIFSNAVMRITIYIFYFTIIGQSITVLIVLYTIVCNNPNMVLQNMDSMGGTVKPGIVLLAYCMYHSWPVIIIAFFTVFFDDHIYSVFRDARECIVHTSWWLNLIMSVWLICSPVILLGIYMCFHDPAKVYGFEVFNVNTILIVTMVCAICNAVGFFVYSRMQRYPDVPHCEYCGKCHIPLWFFHDFTVIEMCKYIRDQHFDRDGSKEDANEHMYRMYSR